MKRLLILLLLCTASASAQTTTVTGTITDPQGNPYQNGTASAQKVVSSGQNPGSPFNTTTNAAGLFSFSGLLALPSPASYIFTICAAPSNIGPKANPTPTQLCFSNTLPIAISGASQDVSAPLNALAPALGPSLSNIQGANNNFTGNNVFSVCLQFGIVKCTKQQAGSTFDVRMANAITALAGPGIVDARDEVSPTLAGNVTINQTGLTVLMPSALLSFGTNSIIVSQGTNAVRIIWPNQAWGSPTISTYTGTGAAIQVGSSAGDTDGFYLENAAIDVTNAGANAIAIQLNRCRDYVLMHPRPSGLAGSGQKLIDLEGFTNFTGGEIFNPVPVNGGSQIFFGKNANANFIYGGTYACSLTVIGLNFDGGGVGNDGNRVFGGDIENCATAVRMDFATNNELHLRVEANTNSITTTTNSLNNFFQITSLSGNGLPTVTDNGHNNIFMIAGGTPEVSKPVNLITQSAAIPATTMFTIGNGPAAPNSGVYRITWSAAVTQVATTSSVLGGLNGFQITFTDADSGVVFTTPPSVVNNANSFSAAQVGGVIIVNAKFGSAVQYQFGYTSVGAQVMQYSLHIRAEQMN